MHGWRTTPALTTLANNDLPITNTTTRPAFSAVVHCGSNNGGCSGNATCTNIPEGHKCACNPGFIGDGNTCTRECVGGGCRRAAPDFESPCCLRLASRAVGAEYCCTSSGRHHQHAPVNHGSPRPHVLRLQPWTRAPSTTEAAALMPPAPLVVAPATAPARRASLATASFAQASGGSMRGCSARMQ